VSSNGNENFFINSKLPSKNVEIEKLVNKTLLSISIKKIVYLLFWKNNLINNLLIFYFNLELILLFWGYVRSVQKQISPQKVFEILKTYKLNCMVISSDDHKSTPQLPRELSSGAGKELCVVNSTSPRVHYAPHI
jgi:hypothetical protein